MKRYVSLFQEAKGPGSSEELDISKHAAMNQIENYIDEQIDNMKGSELEIKFSSSLGGAIMKHLKGRDQLVKLLDKYPDIKQQISGMYERAGWKSATWSRNRGGDVFLMLRR